MNPFHTFKDILKKYISDRAIAELPIRWKEKHRHYHTVNHLIWVIQNIETNMYFKELNVYEKHALLLAAFFHDAIYDPKRKDNEDQSIKLFVSSFKAKDIKMLDTVCELIECTKHRKRPINKLQRILWDADNKGFFRGYDIMLKSEKLIRQEYSHFSNKEYKKGRLEFLNSCKGLFDSSVDKNLDKLIEYVEKTY